MNTEIEFVQNEDESQLQSTKKINKQRIPAEYVPIKLSSLGKLDAPSIVHIKDYSGKDVLELSLAINNNSKFLRCLVNVINNVIFEGFDCNYLHEHELEEIMLNITGNFISPNIQNFSYPYENEEYNLMDEERKNRIEKGLEKLQVDIPINSINTNPIKSEFKEPITIKYDDLSVQFRLPRVGDYFVAEDYIEEKYIREAQEYVQLEKIGSIEDEDEKEKKFLETPRERLKEYQNYLLARGKDYIIAKQSQLLLRYGSKVLDTVGEKIKHYSKVGMRYWKTYNTYCNTNLQFGVNHDIKMISPITKEEVTRRLQFRPMDFISSDNIPDSGEHIILFG